MRQQTLLPDGRYELCDGDRVKIVEASDLEAEALAFFSVAEQPVPETVSPRQARLALLSIGMLDEVEQALAQIPGAQGKAAQIDWEYATEVQRGSPLIAALGPALGLTDAQIDDLFRAAVAL